MQKTLSHTGMHNVVDLRRVLLGGTDIRRKHWFLKLSGIVIDVGTDERDETIMHEGRRADDVFRLIVAIEDGVAPLCDFGKTR